MPGNGRAGSTPALGTMRYYKTEIFGVFVISEKLPDVLNELEILLEETEDPITIQAIEMTEEEFNQMEEFNGW